MRKGYLLFPHPPPRAATTLENFSIFFFTFILLLMLFYYCCCYFNVILVFDRFSSPSFNSFHFLWYLLPNCQWTSALAVPSYHNTYLPFTPKCSSLPNYVSHLPLRPKTPLPLGKFGIKNGLPEINSRSKRGF